MMLVKVPVRVAVAVSPAVIEAEVALIEKVDPVVIAAFEGPDASAPNPRATTTPSAIRFKAVF